MSGSIFVVLCFSMEVHVHVSVCDMVHWVCICVHACALLACHVLHVTDSIDL